MAEATAGTATTTATMPAQAQTTPQTAPAAPPQPATEPDKGSAQGAGKPLTAPLVKDPMALLNRFRERTGIVKPSEGAKPDAAGSSSASGKPATEAAPAAESSGNGNPAPPAAAESANAPAAEAKPEPADDLAARVARFNRTEREFEQRQRAFAEQQAKDKAEREAANKQHEEKLRQADVVEKASKLLEAGDAAGAILALKGDINPSAFALQLLEQLQKQDERPMSPAEVERILTEKLKAQEEARAKAEEATRKKAEDDAKAAQAATLEGAREKYMGACLQLFSKEKHPFIAAHGLDRQTVVSYAESQLNSGQGVPEPDELLSHFETLYRQRAEAAGWAPKTVEAPRPAPSPSFSPSSLVQDQGGRLVTNGPAKKLEEKRNEIRARLRIAGRQT